MERPTHPSPTWQRPAGRRNRLLMATVLAAIWAATLHGAVTDLVFSPIDATHGLSDNQVLHILQLNDRRIAVTTAGNINIYDGDTFDYAHYNDTVEYRLPDYKGHYHVYTGCHNLVWIKDYGRVRCFDLSAGRYVTSIDTVLARLGADVRPRDLFADADGTLMTVTPDGLLDTRHRRRLPVIHGAALQDIETLGDTAMLFYSDGVMEAFDRPTGRRLMLTRAYDDPTAYTATSLVCKASDGTIYQVRTSPRAHSVLLHFDPASRRWSEVMRTPYVLHTLAMAGRDDAYIASREGLWHLDLATRQCSPIGHIATTTARIPTSRFNTIFVDNSGGVWIGTYSDGVLYGHPRHTRLLSRRSLGELGIDSTAVIGRPDTRVAGANSVITDSMRRRWTGTHDGLRVSTPGIAGDTVLYTEHGLSNNNIKSLATDGAATVWAATANGINAITTVDRDRFVIEPFGPRDGALDGEYTPGPSYTTPDGRILFRHPRGWTVVLPPPPVPQRLGPPLLRRFTVGGRRVDIDSTAAVTLAHHQNDIAIDIAALNFARPEATAWRYRLLADRSPADTAWTAYRAASGNGAMHISAPRLAPGTYRFQVMAAADSASPWSEVTEIVFTIGKPWWLSAWAIALYIVLAAAIAAAVLLVYRHIERRRITRRHNEEKLLMRVTDLIERCNYYESMVKQPAGAGPGQADECDNTATQLSADDRAFIDRAIGLVEANIGTRGYSVEQLGRDLCMERTGLYKRMTALLDKSPSAFIKSIRLRHAAALVAEGQLSMAEIAELTGFSSSSHMSRCFKEERGCTPSEYARAHTTMSSGTLSIGRDDDGSAGA